MNGRMYGWLALLGGLTAVVLEIPFAANGWGPPGSAAYTRYELLNRLMALALVLIAGGWLGIYRLLSPSPARWGSFLALIGAVGMALGTAGEFWLFSDLPYEGESLRQAAYSLFSLAGFALFVGAAWLGVHLWLRRSVPHWSALLFLLGLPLDIAAYFLFGTPFLAGAFLALNVSWLLLSHPLFPE